MGGGNDKETTTQTSGLSNPAMEAAATTIGNQLNTQLSQGVTPFTGSMAPNLSGQTQAGISNIIGASGNVGGINAANTFATNTINSGGYNPALTEAQRGVQSYLNESTADAPGFAALRAKAADDAAVAANSTFTNSGRFGSGSHREGLGQGIASAMAGMDYQNYTDRLNRQMTGNQALAGMGQTAMGNAAGAANMAPSLYQAGLMPGQAQLQAGQVVDANNLMQAQDQARIFDATNNAGWNTLQRGGAIFSGTAPVSGTTQTNSQPAAPWWQAPLQIGGTLASAFF